MRPNLSIANACVVRATAAPIEILDIEYVLRHVIGVQNENKNALINPPSWIFQRSLYTKGHGAS